MNILWARIFSLLILFTAVSIHFAEANNLTVSNVELGLRDAGSTTVAIKFDVAWDNSWRTKINHDAVWLTFRLHSTSVSPTNKKLCDMSATGLNPSGTATGTDTNLEIYVPADAKGAFLRRASNAAIGPVSSEGVEVQVNYGSCGFSEGDQIIASVLGLEMVLVPEGSFYAGDYGTSAASFVQGSSDSDPWAIASEGAISVSNPSSNGYRYVSAGSSGENSTGSSFSIPATFPKGYGGFYMMKYEVTESQWVHFINALPSAAARSRRDITDNQHKNTDSVVKRNTVSCLGSPLVCSTERKARPVGYLSWMDLAAFLDWAALRPMTELEFEKAARGPVLPISGEYAWGSTDITAAATISGTDEDGTETVTTASANSLYANVALSGGDSALGAEYQRGPLRSGIFATPLATRTMSGAGKLGAMELSGNLKERIVTVGNETGRAFAGTHGDGYLSAEAGYEGNANQSTWPGTDATPARGVTGADGTGFRGGSWEDGAERLRISDRYEAASGVTTALSTHGGRGVRTYDGP